MVARRQILWICNQFLSLRAMNILGSLNLRADRLFWGHADVRGVDPASCGRGTDMGLFRASVNRSVHVMGEGAVHEVVDTPLGVHTLQ